MTDIKRNTLRGLLLFLILGSSVSCVSRKEVAYLQDMSTDESFAYTVVDRIIEPGDILSIMVNSRNPELSIPFNRPAVGVYTPAGTSSTGAAQLQGYTVESDGSIAFPILGRITAAGLTRIQLAHSIEEMLKKGRLVNDASVSAHYLNFKVAVLGEVNNPGSFPTNQDRVSIFDAIAMAGDLTINARRDNVLVLREENGKRVVYSHNLLSKDVFNSPAFFLKQNDIVMVEPSITKIQASGVNVYTNISTWLGVLSTGTSMAAFIISLQNNKSK